MWETYCPAEHDGVDILAHERLVFDIRQGGSRTLPGGGRRCKPYCSLEAKLKTLLIALRLDEKQDPGRETYFLARSSSPSYKISCDSSASDCSLGARSNAD